MCFPNDIIEQTPRGNEMTGLPENTLGNRSSGTRKSRMRIRAADDATPMNCLWFLTNNLRSIFLFLFFFSQLVTRWVYFKEL